MDNTMALLLSDTYKQCHDRMYPKGLTKLVSYWVPRRSMLKSQDKMVFFGLQAFIKEYLLGYFQTNFFDVNEEEVIKQYTDAMNIQIGSGNYDVDKIVQLHRLGYLPLEIRALPEGTLVTMGIPCIEITNTKEEFAWLVQWIECILQVELWKPCCHSTIGYMYRSIADYWYKKTTDGLCGHTDEDNLGFTYAVLDRYIRTGEIDDMHTKERIDTMHEKIYSNYNLCLHLSTKGNNT